MLFILTDGAWNNTDWAIKLIDKMNHKNRPLNPVIKKASRRLRKRLTPMERRLWSQLRRRRLMGLHFRRQHPIGRYIVDFYCAAHRLIIEVDGESHNYQAEYDEVRTEWLESQRYRVLRFTNSDVRHRLRGVLLTIQEAVEQCIQTDTVE